jgi:calcineurin-like phosphoesterase family protein
MPKVWFTSDSHYGHKNIVDVLSDWTDKSQCRRFDSLAEMNDALVDGINKVVAPDDVLYHLGDFNFGGIKNLFEFRGRIKCETIHWLLGNHDLNHGEVKLDDRIRSLFASVQHYKEIVVGGKEIVLCHYAMRVWNRQGKGAWHLYGHSHGTLPQLRNFSMDVGVDRPDIGFFAIPMNFFDVMNMFHDNWAPHEIEAPDHHSRPDGSTPSFRATS